MSAVDRPGGKAASNGSQAAQEPAADVRGVSGPGGTRVLQTGPGTQVLRTGPGTQVLQTGPRTQVLQTGPGTQVLQTGPGTQVLQTGPGAQVPPAPAAAPWTAGAFTPLSSEAPASGAAVGVEPCPGDHVRQYELIRRLGRGGMGEVFLARDTKLGRRVAIKFLHTQDPALVQRFVVEARATASCGHENIVTLYEADTHQGRPYMVLEYLQGHTLAELLGGKPLPPG